MLIRYSRVHTSQSRLQLCSWDVNKVSSIHEIDSSASVYIQDIHEIATVIESSTNILVTFSHIYIYNMSTMENPSAKFRKQDEQPR